MAIICRSVSIDKSLKVRSHVVGVGEGEPGGGVTGLQGRGRQVDRLQAVVAGHGAHLKKKVQH